MTMLLALRNLFLQRKRYSLLSLAVLTGFMLVTVVTGLVFGALDTIKDKAARYFSGHVNVIGFNAATQQEIKDPRAIVQLLTDNVSGIRTISPRTVYYRQDCTIFFNGETIRQRRLIGMDFSREIEEFRNLAFIEGSIDSMVGPEGENGILISRTASRLLGARVGDDINVFLTTDSGQYNSATLYVRGIFDETSLFGYVAYMRRQDLNRLVNKSRESATDIAVYAQGAVSIAQLTKRIRYKISEVHKVFPPIASREALLAALSTVETTDQNFAIVSLDAQLAQIKDIMDALLVITYFVLAIFILIVMVGILSTYRVLVYERTREIGTIRALGMQRGTVARLFLYEAGGLGLFASIGGLGLGLSVLWLISSLNFGTLPAAGMFTESGHLNYFLDMRILLANMFGMTLAVMLAAWEPARTASRVQPAEALRGES